MYADEFGINKYQKESENVNEGPEDFFGKGIHAASDFLERNIAATAVIDFNDEFSLGMMKGFSTHGIRVPQDISIMGIDGNEIRRYREPLLTTMDVFPEKQGEKCMEVLLDMIEGKTYKYRNYTSFSLSEGDSILKINK